jgi:hypothetical protein
MHLVHTISNTESHINIQSGYDTSLPVQHHLPHHFAYQKTLK